MAPVIGHFEVFEVVWATSATAIEGDSGMSGEDFRLMKRPAASPSTATMPRMIQLLEPLDEFTCWECDDLVDAILNMVQMTLCQWMDTDNPAEAKRQA
tara:strand:- start:113 stop:406 length:294 start_codon:yes stop_codon:yes gene_type:complete